MEIYNPSTEIVDLTWYGLASVTNAPSVVGEYENWFNFPPGATIAPDDVYVIAHSSADASILAEADMTLSAMSNGDDGFALVYGPKMDMLRPTSILTARECMSRMAPHFAVQTHWKYIIIF